MGELGHGGLSVCELGVAMLGVHALEVSGLGSSKS